MDQPGISESIAFSRPPEVPGVEILAADHTRRLFRVYHETYTLCIGTGGEWIYRQRTRLTKPGEVMLIEPGELHVATTLIGGVVRFRVAFIDPGEIGRVAADIGNLPALPHLALANVENDRLLFDRLAQFFASLEQPSSILERQSRLTAAVGWILQRYTETGLRSVRSGREPGDVCANTFMSTTPTP